MAKELGLDKNGVQKMMHTGDYLADMAGQFGMNLTANLVGQLTYFYTDKATLAVAGVGTAMLIVKFIDAITDLWFGNIIDHSKGGSAKYYKWVLRMMLPFAAVIIALFCVPVSAGQLPSLIYVVVTNVLLSAVCMTLIGTPLAAVVVVRTNSQEERESMGVFRAAGTYASGMVIAIFTIPVTNMLGGTQSAWIRYGVIVACVVLLMLFICYRNGSRAKFVDTVDSGMPQQVQEEDAVPLRDAMSMLFHNKYWVIVVLFNVITQVTNSIAAASGTYYCKWIFGNDNLVAIVGAGGFVATLLGFVLSKAVISYFGVRKTISFGLLGAAVCAAIRCITPTFLPVYIAAGAMGSFIQIPMMCLYGVIMAMAVDYNEYKYDHQLVAVSSGAIGIGTKIGSGLGTIILTACLALASYDATLEVATPAMRYAIYAFSNYLPIVINLLMFFVFRGFDLEQKLPGIQAELRERRAAKAAGAEDTGKA